MNNTTNHTIYDTLQHNKPLKELMQIAIDLKLNKKQLRGLTNILRHTGGLLELLQPIIKKP